MKKLIFTSVCILGLAVSGFSQSRQAGKVKQNSMAGLVSKSELKKTVLSSDKTICGASTADYPWEKRSGGGYWELSLTNGEDYAYSQAFEAPEPISISAVDFYAANVSSGLCTLAVGIYAVDGDNMPTGSPLAARASTFPAGTNPGFYTLPFTAPIVVTNNYAIVIEVIGGSGTLRVWSNNPSAGDGRGEWLSGFMTYPTTTWENFGDYVGGTNPNQYQLDLDIFLSPVYTTVNSTANFTSSANTVCPGTEVEFTNTSSGIFGSRFYNLYAFNAYFNGAPDSTYSWTLPSGTGYSLDTAYTPSAPGSFIAELTASRKGWWGVPNCTDTKSDTITVNATDTAAFTLSANSACIGSANVTATITGTTGGTFSASPAGLDIDASTGEIDVTTSTIGTYTVQYVTGGTCPDTATATFTLDAGTPADASFTLSADTVCANTANVTATAVTAGGVFSATPAGLDIDPATGEIDVTASNAGAYVVQYVVNGTCSDDTVTVDFLINGLPQLSLSGTGVVCAPGDSALVGITLTGATPFTIVPSLNGISNPLLLSYTATGDTSIYLKETPPFLTYGTTFGIASVTDANGCVNDTISDEIFFDEGTQEDASFSLSATAACQQGANVTATVTGTQGGVFSATPAGLVFDASTGEINVATSSAGVYSVTYTTNGVCNDDSTVTFTVTATDIANFTYGTNVVCQGSGILVANNTGAAGTYSATPAGLDISSADGEIDVDNSADGTYTITLTTNGTCPATDSVSLTITNAFDASFAYTDTNVCATGTATVVAGSQAGTYSLSSATPSANIAVNPTTGEVTVSGATSGDYFIVNTISASGTCSEAKDSVKLTVLAAPTISISGGGTFCTGDSVAMTVEIVGGTGPWDLELDIAGNVVQYPVTADSLTNYTSLAGVYRILSVVDANGCVGTISGIDSIEVTENSLPVISFASASVCVSADSLILNATPAGGIFSSTVAGTVVDSVFYTLNGTQDVVYSYTDLSTGCSASDTVTITVDVLNIVFAADTLCSNGTAVTLGATPSGGVFSGTGVTGTSFNPATAGAGTHAIKYVVTSGACQDSTTVDFVVNAPATATFTLGTTSVCANASAVDLTAGSTTTPSGGLFSGTGVTGNNFDPASGTTGSNTITYTASDANGCTTTATATITVNAAPSVNITAPASICIYNPAATLSATPAAGGTFSGPGVTGSSFNPAAAGLGTHTVTYTVTVSGCQGQGTANIVVSECLSIDDMLANGKIVVYPNPATEYINVEFSKADAQANVTIINVDGKVVYNANTTAGTNTIDVSSFAKGTYFVRVNVDGAVKTATIVIQ